jgi:GNAT superfamily N-acetyltransferase
MKLRRLATDMAPFPFNPTDLAPGDGKSAAFDAASVRVDRVNSRDDPLFEFAYRRLWEQFGASAEIETREVLGRRLAWDAARPRDGFAMRYDLLVVRDRDGGFVAARDHTAIADAARVVVHLSHALVDPAWRRSGLAGWLRALPLQTARACLERAEISPNLPITLCAEMEYPDGKDEARPIRLRAYERSGYKKIDPAIIDYRQPDFRPAEIIDASGGPAPLRFQLIVRRVGREGEEVISGAEVRAIVQRFYAMYGQEFRTADMAPLWAQLATYPAPDARVALLPPTA